MITNGCDDVCALTVSLSGSSTYCVALTMASVVRRVASTITYGADPSRWLVAANDAVAPTTVTSPAPSSRPLTHTRTWSLAPSDVPRSKSTGPALTAGMLTVTWSTTTLIAPPTGTVSNRPIVCAGTFTTKRLDEIGAPLRSTPTTSSAIGPSPLVIDETGRRNPSNAP